MGLRRELILTLGALVALNLLLAFGAIGLFVRMGPVIDRILQENMDSITAAEEMMVVLALQPAGRPVPGAERNRILSALERARGNVTEDDEPPVLDAIERALPAVLEGNAGGRQELVERIRSLIDINRRAMSGVDREARRLGRAGGWAAVFVGALSLLANLLVAARLRRRLLLPLEELDVVLEEASRGDPHRRCGTRDAPEELMQVTRAVNRLLDERARWTQQPPEDRSELEERALIELLETCPGGPAALVDPEGNIVRASRSMLERLAAGDERLRRAISEGRGTRVPIGDLGWLVPAPAAPDATS